MPVRGGMKNLDAVGALLQPDAKACHKAWEDKLRAEELNKERALREQMAWDQIKKYKPHAPCEELIAAAHRLEEKGQLMAAADAYQAILTRPKQSDNQQLRAHLANVIGRINRQQAELRAAERAAELEEDDRLYGGRPKGLQPRQRVAGVPRSNKPVGPPLPMSPDAYRAELDAQAMAAQRRKEAARRTSELLAAKELAVAANMEALNQHQRLVVGANEQLVHQNETDLQRKAKLKDRRHRFYMEWDQLKAARDPGPSAGPGVGELQRQRDQIQEAHAQRAVMRNSYDAPADRQAAYHGAHGRDPRVMIEQLNAAAARASPGGGRRNGGGEVDHNYHQPAGLVAAGLRNRPATAGAAAEAAAVAREREAELDLNNARNYQQLHVPGHPYAPKAAWSPHPVAGGGGAWNPSAAAAGVRRPGVDQPRVRIDPNVVRAKQQAFIDRHNKPPPEPQQHVPLRVRMKAVRRPLPPQVTEEAYRLEW